MIDVPFQTELKPVAVKMGDTFGKGRAVTQNRPQRVKRVNEATETLAASPKIKISFLDVARSHGANLQSYYLSLYLSVTVLRRSESIQKQHTLTLAVFSASCKKAHHGGQALLMAVVYVCLAPATLH